MSAPSEEAPAPIVELTEKQRLRKERAEQEKARKIAAKSKQPAANPNKQPKAAKGKAPAPDASSSSSSSSSAEAPKAKVVEKEKDKGPRLRKAYVNQVPKGEKKPTSSKLSDMPKEYDPPYVESAWYEWWEANDFFHPSSDASLDQDREKFIIVIPPPNVTGALHIGHALTNSIQDVLCRWHRMNDRLVLWVPGTDHAGIATQDVVEKRLMATEGKDRHFFGREAFIQKVWEWKDQYESQIQNQLRRIGSSVDWKRSVFTLDEKLSKAVIEAFVRFYDDKLIYRDNRLVNWCCKLNTAISDIEVTHIELDGPTKISGKKLPGHSADREYDFGVLFQFAYKLEGDDSKELIVATTRLETMLGDSAVAVHPTDERYVDFHGKFLIHPFTGRKLPVVLDEVLVKKEFGTGCVKITPAHDPNDYQCGKRHGLDFINILTEDGCMNENCPEPYRGLPRFDCRQKLIDDLTALGVFRGIVPNAMSIGTCSRTGDIIEPMIKPQWWVSCKDLAKRAADSVRSGELQLIPKTHEREWFRWLDNIQDWCISRQLWWGHRIPAYRPVIKGELQTEEWIIKKSPEEALQAALAAHPDVSPSDLTLDQDPDVLDTWFSSGLFPFSVFGWPDNTPDLSKFYPTSLLETGQDILFFWVARMVMMGQQLTGKLPFDKVFLHAMVRDTFGRKMSKSKGNVINPIDVIEGATLEMLAKTLQNSNLPEHELKKAVEGQSKMFPDGISECGTDAMRFALCHFCGHGAEIHLNIPIVVTYRNFCNKLWNALRYSMGKWGDDFVAPASLEPTGAESSIEKWILSRLSFCVEEVHRGFETFDFSLPTTALHNFFLKELCQVYLEVIRPVVSTQEETEAKKSALNTLYNCLEAGFRLLQPFMPFLTEELWQRLPRRPSDPVSICVALVPKPLPHLRNLLLESQFEASEEIVRVCRQMRAQYGLVKQKPVVALRSKTEAAAAQYKPFAEAIAELSSSSAVTIINAEDAGPEGSAIEIVNDQVELLMSIRELIDLSAEIVKMQSQILQKVDSLDKQIKRTLNPNYSKVPLDVQEKNSKTIEQTKEEIQALKDAIVRFETLLSKNE
eukprot:CAMPEP_0184340888 /NCGR_PEP_ID=MMETSP1089-20130417/9525_1 /TAXON_ID=38269 ORGANISM="Gloeochaete wittrockiana, Strain SAG46.84" /NCGR_SAMPLE_ID=MMETSP1089 /ASSEMBLY_ACC=CAM_ASM_000445 /LENGTH=1079 /DNA_ID=CAMNT_0026668907 /DNA_START=48 /DNA_END=3285 /DNA_ORIENTATION=+